MAGYTLEGPKWSNSNITWSFSNTPVIEGITSWVSSIGSIYRDTVQQAMQRWDAVSGLTFTQINDGPGYAHPADIRIGFGKMKPSTTGVIAEANYSVNQKTSSPTFNPDVVIRLEDPADTPLVQGAGGFTYQGYGITLYQLVLHEVGHALGLDHSSDPTSIMYTHPGYASRDLNADDIAGMQALYGPEAPPVSNKVPPVADVPPSVVDVPPPVLEPALPAVDKLVLRLSGDAWQGDAQFVVMVNGKQVGGAQTVTASRVAGQQQDFTVSGNFGSAAHSVSVKFLNDAWGGTGDTDRNMFVNGAELNGVAIANTKAALWSNGAVDFSTSGKGDTITFNLSEDAYNGDAQAIVYVDGKQLGGIHTITASHALGLSQSLTFTDAVGAGARNISVQFINDAWGDKATTDRNIYVDSVVIGGQLHDMNAAIWGNEARSFDIPRPATTPAAFTLEQSNPYPILLST